MWRIIVNGSVAFSSGFSGGSAHQGTIPFSIDGVSLRPGMTIDFAIDGRAAEKQRDNNGKGSSA